MDLLFIGDSAAYDSLVPVAARAGIRLHAAEGGSITATLGIYWSVLDGVLVLGVSEGLLRQIDLVAPGLPVVIMDSAPGSTLEGLGGALYPERLIRKALSDLTVGRRAVECARTEGADPESHLMPDGRWVAHIAYRLEAVAAPREGEQSRFTELATRWSRALIDSLSCLPSGVSLRVRYAAKDGEITVGLILGARGSSEAGTRKMLADASADLAPFVHQGLVCGAYVMSREDGDGKELLLKPFIARSAAIMCAPTAEELLPLFDSIPDGLDRLVEGSIPSLEGAEASPLSLPFAGPDAGALVPLLNVLLEAGASVMVDMEVRPAPLDAEERERVLDMSRRASALVRQAPFDGPRRLARRSIQLTLESARTLSVLVSVAAESDRVPVSVLTEVARAFVGDPATVASHRGRATVVGGILAVESPDWRDPLSGRAAPDEAALQFRLPPPGLSVPGIRSTHPARLVVPGSLSSVGGTWGHAPDGRAVRVSSEMLTTHALIVGATGTGKSTLCEQAVLELAEAGAGVLVLDPHGLLAARIRNRLPAARRSEVEWIDAADPENQHRINLLDFDEADPASRDRVFDTLYSFFDSWYDMKVAGGPMFETHLRESLRLLLLDPNERHALPDLVRVFTEESFRKKLMSACPSEATKNFWLAAQATTGEACLANMGPYIYSKINRLLGPYGVRRMVSSPETTMDIRGWLDDGAVVLCSLPVGALGGEGTSVIGSVILSRVIQSGFVRLAACGPSGQPRAFAVIADEAHRFASGSEATVLLAEGRKTGVGLIAATQRLASLKSAFRDAALANCGLVAAMRVGIEDAMLLAPSLAPGFSANDLLQLGRGEAAVRLQLPDGQPTPPFLMKTVPPNE